MRNSRTNLTVIFLVVTASMMVFLPLFAQAPGDKLDELSATLDEQDQLSPAAAKDKQLARDFVSSARQAHEDGERKLFDRRMKRAEFAVDLVRALVAAAVIRQQAEEQEAAAFSAPQAAQEMKSDVERLRKRKIELQSQLRQLGN